MKQTKLTIDNIFREYPDIVKPKDLQKMLGISQVPAYRLLRSGKISNISLNDDTRLIPKQAIIDYLNENMNNKIKPKKFKVIVKIKDTKEKSVFECDTIEEAITYQDKFVKETNVDEYDYIYVKEVDYWE